MRCARDDAERGAIERAAAATPEPAPEPSPEPSPEQRVDALLDWLDANRYQSQDRFVESRVHARAGRYGNLRIRQELAHHQLALPAESARSLAESERQRARAVLARRFPRPPADAADRARRVRFLAGRGFSSDAIRGALRDAAADADGADAPDRVDD